MNRFEVVSGYADKDINIPCRATHAAAGYDFEVAEDIIVPSWEKLWYHALRPGYLDDTKTLEEMAKFTKEEKAKPTLVPTGIKCQLASDHYLELSVRSSTPLKHWLILANGVGIIDGDYYNNPDNEGHIYFQLINLSPFDIQLKKGDKIGQGIIKKYEVTDDDYKYQKKERAGGFGSTSAAADAAMPLARNAIDNIEINTIIDHDLLRDEVERIKDNLAKHIEKQIFYNA